MASAPKVIALTAILATVVVIAASGLGAFESKPDGEKPSATRTSASPSASHTPKDKPTAKTCEEREADDAHFDIYAMESAEPQNGSVESDESAEVPRQDWGVKYTADLRYGERFADLGCAPEGERYIVVQLFDRVSTAALITDFRYEYGEFVSDDSVFSLTIDGETFEPEQVDAREDGGVHEAVFLVPELKKSAQVSFDAAYDYEFTRSRGSDKAATAMDDGYELIPDNFNFQTELSFTELTVGDKLDSCINPKARWC